MADGDMPSMNVTTLAQRKAAEAVRRRQAATVIARSLSAYARHGGGRFVIFGSFVTDTMRFDSDLDILIDFPPDRTADACRFAEDVGASHSLPLDIHDATTTTPAFLRRVLATGVVLP